MQDLRLLAIEQEFIVLEGSNGEKFRLALDDTLRRAIKSDKGILVESNAISPREIQELVRSGHSVDEIVARTGASYSYVEKFATPILEELEHIISSAQSVRLAFLGERYGETNHIEFGTLIRERLDQLGASDASWLARRTETGGIQLTCRFSIDGSVTEAKWAFDLRHLSLSPDNEVALNLAASPKGDAFVPKAKPVFAEASSSAPFMSKPERKELTSTATTTQPDEASTDIHPGSGGNLTVSLGETQEFADVIPFGRSRNSASNVPVVAAGTSAQTQDSIDEIDEEEDLLDGLRRRRDLREAKSGSQVFEVLSSGDKSPVNSVGQDEDSQELEFDDTTVWIETGDEVFIDQDLLADTAPEEPAQSSPSELPDEKTVPASRPSPNAKRGRASMPSWDEIVFGTKPDAKDE